MRVAFVIALMWSATALAGDPTYKPKAKYKSSSGSLKIFDSPEAACQDSVDGLKKLGNKQTFVEVKPGSDEWRRTCMLRDSSGKVWPQTDAITVLEKCTDGNDSTSNDMSGTIASQVCPCDPVKGCPVQPPADEGCDAGPTTCDTSPRCTQQAEHKTSKAEATRKSEENARETAKDKALVDKYNAVKAEVQKQQFDVKKGIHGDNLKTNGFPEFAASDLYQFGPNDVNIGKLCGSDDGDFAAANNVAGYGKTPPGYTWHHHEDLGRFQLVRTAIHKRWESAHWGGRSIWKRANGLDKYPKCCPKKP
jgi:A nuclease of the HNH/ENDO VII superfamily with conserved WHH